LKWIRFERDGRASYGLVNEQTVAVADFDLKDILLHKRPPITAEYPLDSVRVLAPIPHPGKIICIGRNYAEHAREQGAEPPTKPLIFAKFPSSIIAHGQLITWSPELTQQVDYEGELAVVIGRAAMRVKVEEALSHVFGYTIANDVTARDLQRGDGQWTRGKSLDTFCPLGPIIVTADEIPDPQNLRVRTELNSQIMQDGHTRDMMFSVAYLIHYCSQAFTLDPGDLILTGTPEGVGTGRTPPVFMQNGDRISVEIEGIGRLENTCKTI